MQRTITTVEISCDVCGAEKISPARLIHREIFGYRLTEAIGVEIRAVAFGNYCEHVCVNCAMKAFHAAIQSSAT